MFLSFGVKKKSKIFFNFLMAIVFQWLFMGIIRNDPSGALFDLFFTQALSAESDTQ